MIVKRFITTGIIFKGDVAMEKQKISIVVPVYNSEMTITTLVEKINNYLSSKYYVEFILVNDNSKDNSLKVGIDLANKYENVKFVDLSKNFGQHNAIMVGLNISKGDIVITMDDDLQNPPKEVGKLIEKINEGFDVVYAKYGIKKHSWFRNFGSKFNDYMSGIMLKKPKTLYFTSFRAIRRYVVDEMTKYKGPYPYIDGLIIRSTNNISDVLVEHNERKIGKSNYTLKKLIKLWLNMFTSFSIIPLRIAMGVGFLLSAIGFIFAIILIIRKIISPSIVVGWTSIIVASLIFSGVQLLSIGMLGEYLGRIYIFQNKSPQYVIRKVYSKNREEEK